MLTFATHWTSLQPFYSKEKKKRGGGRAAGQQQLTGENPMLVASLRTQQAGSSEQAFSPGAPSSSTLFFSNPAAGSMNP